MAVDLGKQYGPLPLGAWIVVVAGGLGIAYYTRQSGGSPIEVVDTSGQPGVGTGAVGGWVPTSPPQSDNSGAITTNEEWARACINWLIAQGYDATVSDSAVRKYVAGTKLSIQENVLIGLALVKYGSPPNPLPPGEDPPTIPPPNSNNPPPSTNVPAAGTPQIANAFSSSRGVVKVNMIFGANTSYVRIVDNGGPIFNPAAATLATNVTSTTKYINVPAGHTVWLGVRAYNSAGKVSSQSKIVKVRSKT